MKALSIAMTMLLAAGAAEAQMPRNPLRHTPRPTTTPVTVQDLMTRLYIFADDSMLGREAGTPGHIRGTDYIESELRRIGAAPGGDGSTFRQDFVLETMAVKASLAVAGEELGADHFLPFPPVGLPDVGAPFAAENVNVVFGGKLGSPNLVAPDAVAGKLVLFAPADGPTGWQFWMRLPPQMYQRYRGARGILVAALDVAPPDLRGFLRGEGQMRIRGEAAPPPASIPVAYVSTAAAERMMGGSVTGILPGAEGKVVSATAAFDYVPTAAPGRNVVAIVPGTDPALKGQYVAFGAHSDHDGLTHPVDHDSLRAFNTIVRPGGAEDGGKQATPAQLDSVRTLLESLRARGPARVDTVMNGADDDGSGSMALLELAEYFVKNPVRRSLLFVWHTAEEKGLFGSQYFTDQPTVPRDSIVAALNMDMIGRGGPEDERNGGAGYLQLLGSRRLSTQLGDLVEEVNSRGNHGFTFDYTYDANGHPQQFYCRSDHWNYARYGIPVVFFSTGGHRDYHMATDEPQYIDFEKYARVTAFIGEVGKAVANLDTRLAVDKPKPDPKGPCQQ